MMGQELLMYILLIKTVQSISATMYILCILQGGETTSATALHKNCCRTCG